MESCRELERGSTSGNLRYKIDMSLVRLIQNWYILHVYQISFRYTLASNTIFLWLSCKITICIWYISEVTCNTFWYGKYQNISHISQKLSEPPRFTINDIVCTHLVNIQIKAKYLNTLSLPYQNFTPLFAYLCSHGISFLHRYHILDFHWVPPS